MFYTIFSLVYSFVSCLAFYISLRSSQNELTLVNEIQRCHRMRIVSKKDKTSPRVHRRRACLKMKQCVQLINYTRVTLSFLSALQEYQSCFLTFCSPSPKCGSSDIPSPPSLPPYLKDSLFSQGRFNQSMAATRTRTWECYFFNGLFL